MVMYTYRHTKYKSGIIFFRPTDDNRCEHVIGLQTDS